MKIYNTLTKRKEEFVPVEPGKVKMYVCGPTVYNFIHIGNARPMIVFDTVRRYFEYKGYDVNYVSNFTDVDDKIIKKAIEEGVDAETISKRYIAECKKDMEGMNIEPATKNPLATEEICGMLNMISTLIEKGYAYVAADGTVYYSVRKFKDYGKLSHKNLDDLQSGFREIKVTGEEGKQDPNDFVLWKPKKEGEPYWESPWCEGRPGWHIECSVMAKRYLGDEIDIHAGGEDLIFPHHENEIAQSEAATGHQFARTWMHSGPLRVRSADGKEEKMSKSLGNFWTIRDALKETNAAYGEGCGAEVLRFFLLRSQYRSPITFSSVLIEEAHKALVRLYTALKGRSADRAALDWNEPFAARFKAAMDDDFNTALAVSVLFELATEINRTGSPELVRQLLGLGRILNILGMDPEKFLQGGAEASDDASRIEGLIEERALAKKAKNFARADEIRKSLLAEGIELQDGAAGTTWRRI